MNLPEASPVKGRPVRFEPWAPGASPSTSTRASGIAEAWNRLSPVVAIEVGAALFARDSLAIFDQARDSGCRQRLRDSVEQARRAFESLYAELKR